MEDKFTFTVLVNEKDEVEVEIPEALHQKVGKGYVERMERFEFGFHFEDIVQRDFPELHKIIMQAIQSQMQKPPKYIYYSLSSEWFEEEGL